MTSTVFISYAREDIDAAERLYADLRAVGLSPWIDSHKLLGGQDWKNATIKAIRDSDFFIALFSNFAVTKKGYVQREIREAIDVLKSIPAGDIFFIPVRLEPCAICHDMISDLHRIDVFPDWPTGVAEIQKAIKGRNKILVRDQDPEAPPEAIGNLDTAYCEIRDALISAIAEVAAIEPSRLDEDVFLRDLDIDSLTYIELLITLEGSFRVDLMTADAFRLSTVRSLVLQILFGMANRDKMKSDDDTRASI